MTDTLYIGYPDYNWLDIYHQGGLLHACDDEYSNPRMRAVQHGPVQQMLGCTQCNVLSSTHDSLSGTCCWVLMMTDRNAGCC